MSNVSYNNYCIDWRFLLPQVFYEKVFLTFFLNCIVHYESHEIEQIFLKILEKFLLLYIYITNYQFINDGLIANSHLKSLL